MNTKVISEKIISVIHKCQNALALRDDQFIQSNKDTLQANLDQIATAFSGSYLGYHANVYYNGFQTPQPGDHFSTEWGFGGGLRVCNIEKLGRIYHCENPGGLVFNLAVKDILYQSANTDSP